MIRQELRGPTYFPNECVAILITGHFFVGSLMTSAIHNIALFLCDKVSLVKEDCSASMASSMDVMFSHFG